MNTQSVPFLKSITTKVTIGLMIAFALVLITIFYVVNTKGYQQIRNETNKLTIETGAHTVSVISSNINSVMRSAEQLRATSEVISLDESSFQGTLNNVFTEDNYDLLGSGGIWPDAYQFDSSVEAYPLTRLRNSTGYTTTTDAQANQYLQTPWFAVVKSLQPKKCLWNHIQASQVGKQLAISCALAVHRDNQFWGATTVNFRLDLVQKNIEKLNSQLGNGYAILLDNTNQVIASSDDKKMPVMDTTTGSPVRLKSITQNNASWQTIFDAVTKAQQTAIAQVKPNAPDALQTMLSQFEQSTNANTDSMYVNYAAFLQENNPNVSSIQDSFIGEFPLEHDNALNNSANAYVFNIPETMWKLVIVKPNYEINGIAEDLSKNIIKYVMFTLLFTLAIIFFLLNHLALSPMEDTVSRILNADNLINQNKYHQLSSINFPKDKADEMGIVNSSLKKLLNRIQSNEGELASINQKLEQRVDERTAELKNTLQELKSSQVQLIRSEKMATLGQMVAGVAHEVNTPLTYVQNNVEIIGQLTEQYEELIDLVGALKESMIDEETPEEDIETLIGDIIEISQELKDDDISNELKDLIKDSLFGVEQISEMVINLRNFSRLDESNVKKSDLRECVNTSLKIARNSIKHHNVVTELNDIPSIDCAPSQINQVLINLLNNAAQAIGDKPDGNILVKTACDNDNVYIDIKDNGSGMSDEVLNKIFEPFFTTKGAGEGTGLGMAISQQIMEQHNGSIKVKSKEGVGTIFRLIFPINNTISNHA